MDQTHHFDFPEAHLPMKQSLANFASQMTRYLLSNVFFFTLPFFAAFLALALYSYDPTDMSFNTLPDSAHARNLMGRFGAYGADLLMQLWGYGSYMLVFLCFFWAFLIRQSHGFHYGKRRLIWGLCALICAAGFFAILIDAPNIPTGAGGVVGTFLSHISQTNIAQLDLAQCLIAAFLSLLFLHLATDSKWSAFRFLFYVFLIPFRGIGKIFGVMFGRSQKATSKRASSQMQTEPNHDINRENLESDQPLMMENIIGANNFYPENQDNYQDEYEDDGDVLNLGDLLGESNHQQTAYQQTVPEQEAVWQNEVWQENSHLAYEAHQTHQTTQMPEPEPAPEPEPETLYLSSQYQVADAPETDFAAEEYAYARKTEDDYQDEIPDEGYDISSLSFLENHQPQDNGQDNHHAGISESKNFDTAPAPETAKQDTGQDDAVEVFNPQADNRDYQKLPSINLLQDNDMLVDAIGDFEIQNNAQALEKILQSFKIKGSINEVQAGPIITLYEFEPAPGVKTSQIIALCDDVARAMSANSVRIAPISGKNTIGIELPNAKRSMVGLKEIIKSQAFQHSKAVLPLVLGKNIGGDAVITDLATMPHLLIAGTTGSGKSVGVNAMILSLLYRYRADECRMIMIDPKMLELSIYNDIPHLLTPVVTEPKRAIVALKWAVREMERRYKLMAELNARNITNYNKKLTASVKQVDEDTHQKLPYIVIVVDEMADLMLVAGKEIEVLLQRLAQMARAAGIHLITATQRPSVDVVTGTIKANFPSRISYKVTSKFDSRTILGEQGAENLLGQGDMLFMPSGQKVSRVHGPFTSDQEVEAVCDYLRHQGDPVYVEGLTEDQPSGDIADLLAGGNKDDTLYCQAVELISREQKASTSFIQRHLQIGYNRAARIIDQMEEEGLISDANHVGRREVLVARS